jgi:hypothetical protein
MNPWELAHAKLSELEAAIFETQKVIAELLNRAAADAEDDFELETRGNIADNLSAAGNEVSEAVVYCSHVLGVRWSRDVVELRDDE